MLLPGTFLLFLVAGVFRSKAAGSRARGRPTRRRGTRPRSCSRQRSNGRAKPSPAPHANAELMESIAMQVNFVFFFKRTFFSFFALQSRPWGQTAFPSTLPTVCFCTAPELF